MLNPWQFDSLLEAQVLIEDRTRPAVSREANPDASNTGRSTVPVRTRRRADVPIVVR
jgi:hypothetical protein